MTKSILVVVAHADDEALGCGGTIARHVAEGDCVHLVVMADGATSRIEATNVNVEHRKAVMENAIKILGITEVFSLGLPDNRMDSIPLLEIVQDLEPIIQRISPSVIYTHHYGDLNIDHRQTYEAVMTACRPLPGSTVKEIYGFQVLSSTEWSAPQNTPFLPNLFVNINEQLSIKIRALQAYGEEMCPVPHSRSVEHAEVLAQHSGYNIGIQAAEEFVVYRIIR